MLYDKRYSNKFKFFNCKNNPMKIYVNGQQKSFESNEISLTSLIEKLALNEKKFAIEYNGEIIIAVDVDIDAVKKIFFDTIETGF